MPYIMDGPLRRGLDDAARNAGPDSMTDGEFTYFITRLLVHRHPHGYTYSALAADIGILECVKQEFYRRVVAPYEDVKCEQNGDAYE